MRLRYFRTVLEIKSRCHFIEVLEITSRCFFNESTRNHIALLFHRSYSKITSRCYFKEVTRKYLQVAISMKLLEFYRDLMIPVNLKITYFGPCHLFPHRYTLLGITHPSTRNYILFLNKNISLIREKYLDVYT